MEKTKLFEFLEFLKDIGKYFIVRKIRATCPNEIYLLLEKNIKLDENSFEFKHANSKYEKYLYSYTITNVSNTLTFEKQHELFDEIVDILEDPEKFEGGKYNYSLHFTNYRNIQINASCTKVVSGEQDSDPRLSISSTDYYLNVFGDSIVQEGIIIELD